MTIEKSLCFGGEKNSFLLHNAYIRDENFESQLLTALNNDAYFYLLDTTNKADYFGNSKFDILAKFM
jgi:hypothetical protein